MLLDLKVVFIFILYSLGFIYKLHTHLPEIDQIYNFSKQKKLCFLHSCPSYCHLPMSPTNNHNTIETQLNPLSLKIIKKIKEIRLQNMIK